MDESPFDTTEPDPLTSTFGTDPAKEVENERLAKNLALAIESLTPELQLAFVGNAVDGLTFRELSEITGIPMGTLMARKAKAVQCLRNRLYSEGLPPPMQTAVAKSRPTWTTLVYPKLPTGRQSACSCYCISCFPDMADTRSTHGQDVISTTATSMPGLEVS